MAIAAAAVGTPIPKPTEGLAFVNPENGHLTAHGVQLLSAWREFMVGGNRVIPCSATGTNVVTLTPNTAAPLLEKYVDYEVFVAAGANDSTGSVTATVVPRKGTLATLKVYIDAGATQAGVGDVRQNRVYLWVYADHLDGGAGGFVLK